MTTQIITQNNQTIALCESSELVITDVQSALDFFMTVKYETGCTRIALNKSAICEDFFILSRGLAGEVLQKFVNYQAKFAIYGDYSHYTSKPLRDFIRESNKGDDVFFVTTAGEAAEKLSLAK